MPTEPKTSIEEVIRQAVAETVPFDVCHVNADDSFRPRMDIKDTPKELVAYIDLPGIDEDELHFSWSADSLCIGGSRDFNHDTEDAEEFTQIERIFGEFLCRIPLDETVDISKATAKYKRGVLKVHLPRRRDYASKNAGKMVLQHVDQAGSAVETKGKCDGSCPDCASRKSDSSKRENAQK